MSNKRLFPRTTLFQITEKPNHSNPYPTQSSQQLFLLDFCQNQLFSSVPQSILTASQWQGSHWSFIPNVKGWGAGRGHPRLFCMWWNSYTEHRIRVTTRLKSGDYRAPLSQLLDCPELFLLNYVEPCSKRYWIPNFYINTTATIEFAKVWKNTKTPTWRVFVEKAKCFSLHVRLSELLKNRYLSWIIVQEAMLFVKWNSLYISVYVIYEYL